MSGQHCSSTSPSAQAHFLPQVLTQNNPPIQSSEEPNLRQSLFRWEAPEEKYLMEPS